MVILTIILSFLFLAAVGYIVLLRSIVVPDLHRKLQNFEVREKVFFEVIADQNNLIAELYKKLDPHEPQQNQGSGK